MIPALSNLSLHRKTDSTAVGDDATAVGDDEMLRVFFPSPYASMPNAITMTIPKRNVWRVRENVNAVPFTTKQRYTMIMLLFDIRMEHETTTPTNYPYFWGFDNILHETEDGKYTLASFNHLQLVYTQHSSLVLVYPTFLVANGNRVATADPTYADVRVSLMAWITWEWLQLPPVERASLLAEVTFNFLPSDQWVLFSDFVYDRCPEPTVPDEQLIKKDEECLVNTLDPANRARAKNVAEKLLPATKTPSAELRKLVGRWLNAAYELVPTSAWLSETVLSLIADKLQLLSAPTVPVVVYNVEFVEKLRSLLEKESAPGGKLFNPDKSEYEKMMGKAKLPIRPLSQRQAKRSRA